MLITIPILGFGRSGGYRVISKLATELVELGCDVQILVPSAVSIPYYKTKAKIIETVTPRISNKYIRYILGVINLIREVRKIKKGTIIATQHLTVYISLFGGINVKKYYYVQANEAKLVVGWGKKILAFTTYILPIKKIVNSPVVLPRWLSGNTPVVPPGIDLEIFQSKGKKSNSITKVLSIGFIGRKEPWKGSYEIIEVLRDVEKEVDQKFDVSIAIHVPENASELAGAIKYYEINSDCDLAKFYRACDIFIATGKIEDGAFHYPCAEAMASGCFTISNYSPLKNVGSKLYLEKFSKNQIKEKLKIAIDMYNKEDLYEIDSNREYVKQFSWEKVGLLMHQVISGG